MSALDQKKKKKKKKTPTITDDSSEKEDDSSEKEERSYFDTFPPARMNIEPSTQKIMAHQFSELYFLLSNMTAFKRCLPVRSCDTVPCL